MRKYKVKFYKSKSEWRLRISHSNGRILFVSSEGYKRLSTIRRVFGNFVRGIRLLNYDIIVEK